MRPFKFISGFAGMSNREVVKIRADNLRDAEKELKRQYPNERFRLMDITQYKN